MTFKINPLWWPVLTVASPLLATMLLARNRRFKRSIKRANEVNAARIRKADFLDLPVLEYLEVIVLSEWVTEEGFLGEPGVSYLFRTDQGALLYDIGFGKSRPALLHNAKRLGIGLDQVDALAISHLHMDHMGGLKANRSNHVLVPAELGAPGGKPCYLPDRATVENFTVKVVEKPQMLTAGITSTGPLARSLFFLGWTEEQAVIARLKGKGLVVFSGCGHPTIEVILNMVSRLSGEPIYALGGGLHFPVTRGRGNYAGIQAQMLVGTGRPPWRNITDDDLDRTIRFINRVSPEKVFLSAHDTCDYALSRFENGLRADTTILRAGATYRL